MVDWSLVAVIIALLAYPLQLLSVQPAVAKALGSVLRWLYRLLWPPSRYCDSLEWSHFPHGSLHLQNAVSHQCGEPECADSESFGRRLYHESWSRSLSLMFPPAWSSEKRRKVRKPAALSPWKKYIRTDVETLLVYAYLVHFLRFISRSGFLWDDYEGPPEEVFECTIKLEECDGVLVGKHPVSNPRWPAVPRGRWDAPMHSKLTGVTKADMEAGLAGGIDRFQPQLALLNRSTIRSPVQSVDDFGRGGWVLALAMTFEHRSYPTWRVPGLLSPFVREALIESQFKWHQQTPMRLPQNVDWALARVISVLEHVLQPAFQSSEIVARAVSVAYALRESFERYCSVGSWQPLEGEALFSRLGYRLRMSSDHMHSVSAEDCALVVEVFNKNEQLAADEAARLEPILLEVCRCAIKGIWLVLQFYHDRAYMVEPKILRNHPHRYIYLEEGVQPGPDGSD